MTFYADLAATADQLLTEFGFTATIRAAGSAADPVTGAGGTDGAERTVQAVQTKLDYRTFNESLIQQGDRMFIFGARVERGEYLVDGGAWAVREVMHIEPDNATHVITKALVGG